MVNCLKGLHFKNLLQNCNKDTIVNAKRKFETDTFRNDDNMGTLVMYPRPKEKIRRNPLMINCVSRSKLLSLVPFSQLTIAQIMQKTFERTSSSQLAFPQTNLP